MSAVPTVSSIPNPGMAKPTGMGRVWLKVKAEALRWDHQDDLGIRRPITGAPATAGRLRPIPNSA